MAEPFLGEIKIVSFDFAPKGWAFCNGQVLPINQNQALFSLLGTTFGGDGRVTYALPDFRGRVAVHAGSGFTLGEQGGEPTHTLTLPELPAHNHRLLASEASGDSQSAQGTYLAGLNNAYAPGNSPNPTTLSPEQAVSSVGGGQPHQNMQPYLALNFIIALVGIFPARN